MNKILRLRASHFAQNDRFGGAVQRFDKLELDELKLKHSFHKYFIPGVRHLNKTELFKKLSGNIIALNIAH